MSSDGRFVACADASGQVLLYGFLPHKGAYYKWDLAGKFKAHHSKWWPCMPFAVYEARQSMVALSLRIFKASCTCKHTRFLLATPDDSMLRLQRVLLGCTLERLLEVRSDPGWCARHDTSTLLEGCQQAMAYMSDVTYVSGFTCRTRVECSNATRCICQPASCIAQMTRILSGHAQWPVTTFNLAHVGMCALTGQTRLFSLGADQRLIEYDLASCTAANVGLRAVSVRDCVPPGGSGAPCAMCFAPPMPYYSHSSTETLLLVAGEDQASTLGLSFLCMHQCSDCASAP